MNTRPLDLGRLRVYPLEQRRSLTTVEDVLLDPDAEPKVPYVHRALAQKDRHSEAPIVAVSDWMRAVPDQIRQWVPARFTTLGTDGFGLSDTRPATRRHFAVDAESITAAALAALLLS